jgi:molybdopterin molybdotransferase
VRTIEEHRKEIAALVVDALGTRRSHRVELGDILPGREILASDVVSGIDLPPFDNSQMDGYAVASSDLTEGAATLAVAARIPAGHTPAPLERGTAAPIMTGAPMPQGADAVVQIERADPARFLPEDGQQEVTLPRSIAAGTFVRPTGSDIRAGELLFAAGTTLGAPQWGSLVAAGVASVEVVDRPRILLVSTGEELGEAGRPLGPGKIYDANGASMSVALAAAGAEVALERTGDAPEDLLDLLRRHAGADLVVTTGGVSEGAYEVVRETFEPRGVAFQAVAMQPGGPQGWGVLRSDDLAVPVVCFPGNPVSALISFEVFLREPLLRASGRRVPRRETTAILAEGADSPPSKHQIRRGRLDGDGLVHFVGGPSSHLLHAYATATHLVHVPLGVSRVEAGDEVVVWALDD